MKVKSILFLFLFLNTIYFSNAQTDKKEKLKVLIVDGQNTHNDWPKITHIIKTELETTNLFSVDVARIAFTWNGEDLLKDYPTKGSNKTQKVSEPKTDPNFYPDFKKYNAVIINLGWKTAAWPEKTQAAFETYIKEGGGLVVFHAADNCFPEWEAYNKMIGLGGWGDRNEKDGPYVYYNNAGEIVRDTTAGKGGAHGPQSEYQVIIRNKTHPITVGMPEKWLHTKDELYNSLRGPAKNMEILATAYDDPKNEGTGRHEPALMTINYGSGRIFHNIMGHSVTAVNGIGFLTSMLRGTEWAASGKVTQKLPDNLPTENETSTKHY